MKKKRGEKKRTKQLVCDSNECARCANKGTRFPRERNGLNVSSFRRRVSPAWPREKMKNDSFTYYCTHSYDNCELFNRGPGPWRPKFLEIKRTSGRAERGNRGRKSLTIREIREAPFAEYISDVPLRTWNEIPEIKNSFPMRAATTLWIWRRRSSFHRNPATK